MKSRLWKKLGATQNLIRLWSEDDLSDIGDDRIKQISIKRGSSSPEYGQHVQTMEVATTMGLGVHTGKRIHLDLTTYAGNLLYSLCGALAAPTRPRFFGRIGKMTIDDVKPGQQHATIYAATWDAQLKNTAVKRTVAGGTQVSQIVKYLFSPYGVGIRNLPVIDTPAPLGTYGYTWDVVELDGFSDGIRKFVDDLGLYLHTRRNGSISLVTTEYMWDQANAKIASTMPLTRSQAISPATWEQPAEEMPRQHWVTYKDGNGNNITNGYGNDTDNPNLPRVEYDMSHIRWVGNDNQPNRAAWIGYTRDRDNGYTISEITIDLLRLITSPVEYHRAQAAQLLNLEVGDPVYLSGDWNTTVRGLHFATGIDETITPDSWDLTLSIHPSDTVVGQPTPIIPPRVWESAAWPWNDETREWNGA